MGHPKICLVYKDSFYFVLKYEDSEKEPELKVCFPYSNGLQNQVLEKARKFGREMANYFNLSLEESLS